MVKTKKDILVNYEDYKEDESLFINYLSLKYRVLGSPSSIVNQAWTKVTNTSPELVKKLKKANSPPKVSKAKEKRLKREHKGKPPIKPFGLRDTKWRGLRKAVFKAYGEECMKCGDTPTCKSEIHVDHIMPKSIYPSLAYDFNNLQVLCKSCNEHKGNRSVIDYRPK